MIRLLLALVLSLGGLLGLSESAAADGCSTQVGILGANAECQWTYAEYQTSSSSDVTHTWVVTIQCGNGGICVDHVECVENGESGFVHDVFMDGVDVGDVCVPEADVDQVNVLALITRQFKRLDWPASQLVVQPPGGATLVNFATNFYTDNDQPISKTVKIAGRQVEIRATQVTYTFRFGDGTVVDSATPGRPNPHLDVTHTYVRADPVKVSLDTTYSGEYRIGDGEWTPIDATLTVAGPEQGLDVVEALPQLVTR